jgi:hypothetical protein
VNKMRLSQNGRRGQAASPNRPPPSSHRYTDEERAEWRSAAQRVLKKVRERDAAARAKRDAEKAKRVVKKSSPRRAAVLRRTDATRRSPKPGGDADELLVDALDQFVSLLVEVRNRRHGRAPGPDVELGTIANLFLTPRLIRVPVDVDGAIKEAMADVGRRLAARLSYNELHDTVERIAGDSSRLDWGARFTPLANALNGVVTSDGVTWVT